MYPTVNRKCPLFAARVVKMHRERYFNLERNLAQIHTLWTQPRCAPSQGCTLARFQCARYRRTVHGGEFYDLSPLRVLCACAVNGNQSQGMDMEERIKECSRVTIECEMRVVPADGPGPVVQSQTCSFVMGVDLQYPSVESALMDKKAGDRVKVCVPPEEICGVYDPQLVRELPGATTNRRGSSPAGCTARSSASASCSSW